MLKLDWIIYCERVRLQQGWSDTDSDGVCIGCERVEQTVGKGEVAGKIRFQKRVGAWRRGLNLGLGRRGAAAPPRFQNPASEALVAISQTWHVQYSSVLRKVKGLIFFILKLTLIHIIGSDSHMSYWSTFSAPCWDLDPPHTFTSFVLSV